MVLTPNMASEIDQRDNYMNIKDCLWFVVQHAVNVLSNRAVLQPRIDKPMFICDNATHNQHNNSNARAYHIVTRQAVNRGK